MQDTEHLFLEKLNGHEVVFIEQPLTAENAHLAEGADVVCVFVDCTVSREVLERLTNLRVLVAESTGTNHIDLEAAKERGVFVASVPGYGLHAVAEFTFALLLAVSRKVFAAYKEVSQEKVFHSRKFLGLDLFGKTIGVVGMGHIGTSVAKIAKGFGMEVVAFDTYQDPTVAASVGYSYVSLEELLQQSDVVTLHVPNIPETRHLINAAAIAKMKKGAILINTARGEVVETKALIDALKSGQLRGAGLDVLEGEQVGLDGEELLRIPSVIITPHIAYHSREADMDRVGMAVQAILDYNKAHGS